MATSSSARPGLARSLLALGALVAAAAAAPAARGAEEAASLLRFPHPYRAAVTVCSDTHATTPEKFEAVHTLVNTEQWIAEGSPTWERVFADPRIEAARRPEGGVRGFGLPLGDTIWLYGPSIGVFERFDAASGRPVPHRHGDGRDHREIVDEWMRRGWIDALHTPGNGELPREAVRAGYEWLRAEPHRRLSVMVNHNLYKARSAIEPDTRPALGLVLRNLRRVVTWGLVRTPAEDWVRETFLFPAPRRFPPSQRGWLWTLSLGLVASAGALALCLLHRPWRRRASVLGALAALGTILALLQATPLRYGLGDNPETPYYNADLAREAGFRFYALIRWPGAIFDQRLDLPEPVWGERRTFLRPVTLDDGSRVLLFPRSHFGQEGDESLAGLTAERLDELVRLERAAILYTHWMNQPVFTAAGVEGLARLDRRYEAGEIWVAPTSELLRFERVRAFLAFEAREAGGRLRLEIGEVRDPVYGAFAPELEALRGISFALRSELPVEVRLGGRRLDPSRYELLDAAGGRVLRFPLEAAAAARAR